MPKISKVVSLLQFSYKPLLPNIPFSPERVTCSALTILLDFTPHNIFAMTKNCLIRHFVHRLSKYENIWTVLCNTHSQCSALNVRCHVSHSYSSKDKVVLVLHAPCIP